MYLGIIGIVLLACGLTIWAVTRDTGACVKHTWSEWTWNHKTKEFSRHCLRCPAEDVR